MFQGGGARRIANPGEWSDEGRIHVSGIGESTRTPALFLIGPQVRHDLGIYCFIYRFRQRFAAIAEEIADLLAPGAAPLRQPGGAWGPHGNSEFRGDCEC